MTYIKMASYIIRQSVQIFELLFENGRLIKVVQWKIKQPQETSTWGSLRNDLAPKASKVQVTRELKPLQIK